MYLPDLPACVSTGDTEEEAVAMIAEAIRGHLDVMRDSGDPIPSPRSQARIVRAA